MEILTEIIQAWPRLSPVFRYAWAFWLVLFLFSVLGLFVGFNRFRKWRVTQADSARQSREAAEKNGGKPIEQSQPEIEYTKNVLLLPRRTLLAEAVGYSPGGFRTTVATGFALLVLIVGSIWDLTIIRDLRKGADKATVTIASGHDVSGKSATYKIILLSAEYFWKLGSTDTVVNSEGVAIPFKEKLKSNGIEHLVKRSTDIIALGTASCAGSAVEEEHRSYYRAINLVGWLRELPFHESFEHLYLLNLGQYGEPCGGYGPREPEQRMVMIVGVIHKQPGVDIQQSFRSALEHMKGQLERIKITRYTNWPEERFVLETRF